MKDLLLNLIGLYVQNDGLTGIASLDIPWIFGALTFIVAMCSTYWLIGRILVGVLHE